MFLKTLTCALALMACAVQAQTVVATEHQWTDDVVGSHILQVGADAWHINTSASEDTSANLTRCRACSWPTATLCGTSTQPHRGCGLRAGCA